MKWTRKRGGGRRRHEEEEDPTGAATIVAILCFFCVFFCYAPCFGFLLTLIVRLDGKVVFREEEKEHRREAFNLELL